MPRKIGIVGSWEKDVVGADVSLSKFLSTGAVEVFFPASESIDFSLGEGMPVVIEKGSISWRGRFLDPVGIYTVRLSWKTPVTPYIIGAEAFLA
jgi:hypothetical protein